MPTRSLGTLTLDLIAKTGGFVQGMSKAERESKKWRRQVEKDLKQIGNAFKVASAVAVAGLGLMVRDSLKTAEEMQRLASVAGTSTEEFQRYAAGARAVGIEQDKLGDIFKDTSDKVGDFIQTGGGPLADFFENIAPQVGVTVEQFRRLSGPEALELYVSSLEKANVSQNELTFFMEAIASDASMLLPLLRDNADGFRQLGDQAAAAGAIMDESTIQAANELNAAMILGAQATEGMKNQIAQALLPVLSDFAVELTEVSAQGSVAADVGDSLANVLRVVAAAGYGAYTAFQLVGKSIGAIAAVAEAADVSLAELANPALSPVAAFKVIKNLDSVRTAMDVGIEDISASAEQYAEVLDGIWSAGTDEDGASKTNSRVKELAELLKEAREQATRSSEEIAANHESAAAAAEEANAALEAQQKIQEDYQSLLRDLRTDEEVLTDQVRERLAVLEAVADISDQQRRQTLGRIADAATVDSPEFSGGDTSEAETDLESWYDTQLALLDQFRQERADLNATWDEEELRVRGEYEQRLTDIQQAKEAERRELLSEGYSALLDIVGEYYQGAEGEQAAYARAAIAIGQTLLDERKREALQEIVASTQSAAMGAYDAFSSIPYIGPALGAAAAGVVIAAGGAAAAKVTGLAHDGLDSVPQTGTWLLEKGERVTTEETSAKLDATLDQVQRNQMAANDGSGSGGRNIRIVNAFDTGVIGDYMGSDAGEEVLMNVVRRNQSTIRSLAAS